MISSVFSSRALAPAMKPPFGMPRALRRERVSITYRAATAADLKRCFSMLSDRSAYQAAEECDVPRFWACLLEHGLARSWLVEDRELACSKRALAFGLSVFVTDEFNREIKATPQKHSARAAFLQWRHGARPLLNREEIAQHNAERGLNLFVMAQGCALGRFREAGARIRSRLFEAFLEHHLGYNIKELLQEVFTSEDEEDALGLGWRRVHEGQPLVSGASPALMSMQRADCQFPDPLWRLFYPASPRFRFSDGEKEILEAALGNRTDEEIAQGLEVSIWTIKKRWQKVYQKVDGVVPDLLQVACRNPDACSGQRRRLLLGYLRQCPEEIRPRLLVNARQKPPKRARFIALRGG
jgi:DNA-binding CsgD family transcriptional regulator